MSQSQPCRNNAPQLKLFDESRLDERTSGPRTPGTFTPETRLSELYLEWIRPVLFADDQLDAATIAEYDRSIDLWILFTGDPPLATIDLAGDVAGEVESHFEQLSAAFLKGVRALPGKRSKSPSEYTVLRRVTNINTCLRFAGWPDGKRKGKRIIRTVPLLSRPVTPEVEPEGPQVWELKKIIDAAAAMKTPRLPGIEAPVFWRSLARVAFNTAERRGALLQVKYSDLREVREQRMIPGCEVTVETCRTDLRVPAFARKGRRKKSHTVPLNAAALEAIEAMRGDGRRETIFEWPHGLEHFADCWKDLVTKHAGFPDEPRFHFHRIRSTAITEATAINEQAGALLAGHSSSAVTRKHYLQRRLLAITLPQMPQL